MQRSFISFVGIACGLGWACGGGGGADCPPDYPIERDGFCYRADDGGLVGADGAPPADGGGGGVDSGVPDEDGGGGGDDGGIATDGDVICMSQHPNVMDMRRYCDPGSCYCGDEAMGLDACYVEAVADACCPVDIVCEPLTGVDGGGVICMGQHPNVSGSMRTCDTGWCYCGSVPMMLDSCYIAAVADACCPVATVCY